jgi:hypothetical protein
LPRGEARTARISCHSHQPNKLAKERGEGGVNRESLNRGVNR